MGTRGPAGEGDKRLVTRRNGVLSDLTAAAAHTRTSVEMGMSLEISGNNVSNLPQRAAGPKMVVGERLSMCGQFIINGRGDWKPVPTEQQVPTQCAFDAAVPDAVMSNKR